MGDGCWILDMGFLNLEFGIKNMTGNIQIDQLVRSLLQKDSLEQCSLQELEQFAGRHPYFGAAQLLLAKKMQVENAEGYQDQLQKTYLFFNNPLWVHRLLGETGNYIVEDDPDAQKNGAVQEEQALKTVNGTGSSQEQAPDVAVRPEKDGSAEVNTAIVETPVIKPEEEKKNDEPAVPETITESLAFEPYHTVDYFASQGIKYKPEEKPQDRLGQQLKSFTDWLKTMKRLPVAELATQSEPAAEKKVEQMAERSLQEKEVHTEAMAEVWIKQGNREKARVIYEKLSLQDPSKRAYFAAKIEDLQK
jgi:hypothetical protein